MKLTRNFEKDKEYCKEEQREHGLLGVDWVFAFRALEGWPAALNEIERLQEENKNLKKNLAECVGY